MNHLCETCRSGAKTNIAERVYYCEQAELEHGYTGECEFYKAREPTTVETERKTDEYYDGMHKGKKLMLWMLYKEKVLNEEQVKSLSEVFTKMVDDMKLYGVCNTLKNVEDEH